MILSTNIFAILLSYLIGAIPFGLLLTRMASGVDVRTIGSGNIGATNVLRAAGKKIAAMTLLADMLKGVLPVVAVNGYFHDQTLSAYAAVAAVLGHNYPIYLGFKGGKGVATSIGVVLAIQPHFGLLIVVAWLMAAWIWKYSSLAALIAFAVYPLATFLSSSERSMQALSMFVFGMSYYRHRENVRRLIAGKEPRIGGN